MHGDGHIIFEYLVALFLNLLYLPAKIDGSNSLFPINGVRWSLFFELAINIVYAMCRRFLTTRNLVFVVAASACYLVVQAIFTGSIDYGFLWDWQSISIGSARTIYGFSCGLLLHRMYLKHPTLNDSTGKSILLLFMASISLMFPNIGESNKLIDCFSVIVIFPFCVLLGAKTNPKRIGYRIYEMLGVISYPIYLLHSSVGTGIFRAIKFVELDVKQFAPFGGFLLVAGLIGFTLLLDRFYDRPVRRYFSNIAFSRPGAR